MLFIAKFTISYQSDSHREKLHQTYLECHNWMVLFARFCEAEIHRDEEFEILSDIYGLDVDLKIVDELPFGCLYIHSKEYNPPQFLK
jgi:hypothetical protein